MNAFEVHADGIRQVMDYLGDDCPSITWRNQVVRVCPNSADVRKGISSGGFQVMSDFRFVLLSDELPADLGLKDIISYLGVNYRVDVITHFAGDTLVRFDCNNPTQ